MEGKNEKQIEELNRFDHWMRHIIKNIHCGNEHRMHNAYLKVLNPNI